MANVSIYGMLRPGIQLERQPSPFEDAGQLLTLRQLMQQGALSDLQRGRLETDIEEEGAFKSALRNAPDPSKVSIAELYRASPTRAQAFARSNLETEKTAAETALKKFDLARKKTDELLRRLQGVNDQAGWDQWRAWGAQSVGLGTEREVPALFSSEEKERQLVRGMETKDYLNSIAQKIEYKDVGGQVVPVQVNPRAGPVGPVAGATPLPKTASPEAMLTDARARDPELERRLAAAREAGKQQAEDTARLPSTISKAEQGLQIIDEMIGTTGKTLAAGEKAVKPHPGFKSYVGATLVPGLRFVEGTDTAGFDALYKQITGQAFLQAFESLKGGGQITQIEGEKATQAIIRMSKAQSEAEFVKAAREFQGVLRKGVENARMRAAGPGPGAPARPPNIIPPGTPMPGTARRGGLQFLGFE